MSISYIISPSIADYLMTIPVDIYIALYDPKVISLFQTNIIIIIYQKLLTNYFEA